VVTTVTSSAVRLRTIMVKITAWSRTCMPNMVTIYRATCCMFLAASWSLPSHPLQRGCGRSGEDCRIIARQEARNHIRHRAYPHGINVAFWTLSCHGVSVLGRITQLVFSTSDKNSRRNNCVNCEARWGMCVSISLTEIKWLLTSEFE
jgi:hypothetical protein